MAAFIQKLFGRKKVAPAETKTSPTPSPSQTEKADQQDELREQQLSQLAGSPSPTELESLATTGLTADIRLSAAKALDDKATLQRVQKAAKGKDKGVYQAVRQALQDIRQREENERQIEESITTLIKNAQDQAKSDDTKLYQPRLDALLNRWSELEDKATETQTQAFLQAVHQCRERLETLNAEKARVAQQTEQENQRAETLELLTQTLDELKGQSPDEEPSIASLDALQKTQENRWLEATRDTSVDKQEQKTYESLMLPLRNYIAALRRLSQNRDAIQALQSNEPEQTTENANETTERPSAKELLESIDWPAQFPMPAPLRELKQIAGQPIPTAPETQDKAALKEQAKAFEAKLGKLEEALEAKQLKESKQLFKTAHRDIKQLDHRTAKPLQPRLQLLGGQLRELTDWQGFATRPKQIALCEQMEYLANQPIEPEAKAERIKELQNEWRDLGGSSDRDLWTRFKKASDLAYEPCKEYFSAKSGLKQMNLDTRKTIVEQLRTFVDNADWQAVDWKAAERIHQKARDEWKAAWPVEFRDNRPVQKEFDQLLKQIEEPLNQEREKNEALKQTIVEKAEALVDHEPLSEAMNQAKALQGDWKQIGITRHRVDRKLWQAFRSACDQIFARRDAAKSEQQALTKEADGKANNLMGKVADVQKATDSEELAQMADQLAGLKSEPLSAGVKNELNQIHSALTSKIDAIRNQEKIEQWQSHVLAKAKGNLNNAELPDHWPKLAKEVEGATPAELVIRSEIVAEIPSPAEDQSRRMEIQVQRLADGMGGNEPNQSSLRKLETLIAGWCLLPEGETPTDELAERLNRALAAANTSQ